MAKAREKVRRAVAELSSRRGHEWLTQLAFVLALGLVVARATMGDFSKSAAEPLGSDAPRAAGPATGLALDLLCCVPAILVLARRVGDRQYVLRWAWSVLPMMLLAAWGLIAVAWAADKFAATLAAFHLVAAVAMLWAAAQLVRSWLRLRVVAAVVFGLLLAYFTHSLFYRLIDLPSLKSNWEENKAKLLHDRGMSDDPFLAAQFEKRVLSGELIGFFVSSNTMGAMVVLLVVVSAGLGVQRTMDDREDRTGLALLILAVPLAAWMIFYTQSRTAFATPVLAAGLLAAAWFWRERLARDSRRAFWVGVAVVALAALAVVGHGLYHHGLVHPSLTFRWNYWVGAMRIFARHPLGGVGLDNFGLHYLAARLPEASEEIKDPHNFLVKMLSELGIIGAILCLAWLGRLAWELTRPVAPIAPAKPTPTAAPYTGPRAILTLVVVVAIGLMINVASSIDFAADKGYVFNEILHKVSMSALMLIAASLAAVKSLKAPELDGRPAPLLLYAILVALAAFLLHNLIDFSLFEPGPMMAFAFLAGAALGVRQPSVAGRKRRTPAAAVALGACLVLWLIAAGFAWAPTAVAEDAADDARLAMRMKPPRPGEARRLFDQARTHQRLNADYAFRAAQALMSAGTVYTAEVPRLLSVAIDANPLDIDYYLARARYLARGPEADAQADQIKRDYARVLELNPNEVALRLEYADTLASLKAPADRAEAVKQYREALRYNDLLKKDEPKRLREPRIAEVQKKVQDLEK